MGSVTWTVIVTSGPPKIGSKFQNPMVPNELEGIVKPALVYTHFHVIPMITDDFIDFALLASQYMNTQNQGISETTHITTHCKDHKHPSWIKTNRLKKHVSLDSLPVVEELPRVNFTCSISKEKRKDFLAMLPYLKEKNHQFYKGLLQENSGNCIMEEYAENI
ncbi:hypothetical protein PR048_023641 [Dryococelus australis]|uniref:Uncharacterized protein n=1 Tax=Dryococelus australis TaxID=614101 RepID=A0ABQ9GUP7_9NEOP|nr:hypothetical protein PR048_023641 [Dryococelus australis]